MSKTSTIVSVKSNNTISERSTRMVVTIRDGHRERLNYLHGIGMSWREIARLDDYKPIPAGSLNRFAKHDYLAPKWCIRLGIPVEGKVQVIFGVVPDGAQVIGAQECDCGQWFISNHPRRSKCFICSPYKGKRK